MKPHSHLSRLFYSYDLGADNAPIEWFKARSHTPNTWLKTRMSSGVPREYFADASRAAVVYEAYAYDHFTF